MADMHVLPGPSCCEYCRHVFPAKTPVRRGYSYDRAAGLAECPYCAGPLADDQGRRIKLAEHPTSSSAPSTAARIADALERLAAAAKARPPSRLCRPRRMRRPA